MAIRPPIELSRPTILNIVAIICYCLAILFHIIAFATDSWSSLTLDGVQYKVGLWQGCRHNETTDEWICSTDVFENEAFKTGSDWHIGTRIMMVFALVLLFILEFAIIAYACFQRLERHKSRLVAIILGLSATAGGFTTTSLLLSGMEILDVPDAKLDWSYGILVVSDVFVLIYIPVLFFDRYRLDSSGTMTAAGLGFYQSAAASNYLGSHHTDWSFVMAAMSCTITVSVTILVFVDYLREYNHRTIAFIHFLILIMYGSEVGKLPDSSVQGSYGIIVIAFFLELAIIVLTQLDKRRRFPSSNAFIQTGTKQSRAGPGKGAKNRAFTIEDNGLKSKQPKVSMDTSVSSLSEADTYRKFAYLEETTGSIGSAHSLHTQGTMQTNLSATLNDTSSVESRV